MVLIFGWEPFDILRLTWYVSGMEDFPALTAYLSGPTRNMPTIAMRLEIRKALREIQDWRDRLSENRHFIKISADNWAITHPLQERLEGKILECAERFHPRDFDLLKHKPGVYVYDLEKGIGEQVE